MNIRNKDIIYEIIESAVHHIKEEQRPCGNFLSLSSSSPVDFSNAVTYSTTFFTSNILSCLCIVESLSSENNALSQKTRDDLKIIIRRSAEFLLREKSDNWSFNYFTREERAHKKFSYPDDLDDTFAALIALYNYQPGIISGNVLAKMARLLIATEVKEGGPYRTWIAASHPVSISNDSDVVVNSTVGYFLSLLDVGSPRINEYSAEAIQNKKCNSPYYPGPYQTAYFISRYQGINNASRSLLSEISLDSPTPLESAMLISSCFHEGHPENIPSFMIDRLTDVIRVCGWQPHPFCIDPAKDHQPFYAGASALTAAFVAEALTRYLSQPISTTTHAAVSPPISFHRHIQNTAIKECSSLPQDLGAMAVEKIEDASDAAITTPSRDLQKILTKKGFAISKDITQNIALAGLYGWLAYDNYDDVLDGEKDAVLLPAANYFLRKLTQTYANIAVQTTLPSPINTLFEKTLNTIESANAWEATYCKGTTNGEFRLPEIIPAYGDHDNLADRSIGYAMGPLAELFIAGYSSESPEYRSTELFFRHYLIARQLHDDAHDWEEDLLRGAVNSIAALLIDTYRKQFPDHTHAIVSEIIQDLRTFFWKEVIDCAVVLIHAHLQQARAARDACALFDGTAFMENALTKLEHGAARAIAERDCMVEFLAHL